MVFSADDREIATSGGDGGVRVWDVTSKQVVRNMSGQLRLMPPIQFSHDSKLLAGYDSIQTIRIWESQSGKELRKCKISGELGSTISAWAFSPDDRLLAVGDRDKVVLFDVNTCNRVRDLAPIVDPHDRTKAPKPGFIFDQPGFLSFNPDGRHLALVNMNSLQLWDVMAGHKLAEVTSGPMVKTLYQFLRHSPDGHRLAVLRYGDNPRATDNFQLIVYDAASLREQYKVPLPGLIAAMSFNSRGDILLDANGVTEVRDSTTGKILRSLHIPEGPLDTRVFSNKGKWLATVGAGDNDGNSITLWDLSTGERTATLAGMPMRTLSWGDEQ
jgi:WD40 repeat protein